MSEQDDHALRSTPKLKNIYAWSGSKWLHHQKYKHLLTVMGGLFYARLLLTGGLFCIILEYLKNKITHLNFVARIHRL